MESKFKYHNKVLIFFSNYYMCSVLQSQNTIDKKVGKKLDYHK
jgi:hypothetical protein